MVTGRKLCRLLLRMLSNALPSISCKGELLFELESLLASADTVNAKARTAETLWLCLVTLGKVSEIILR